MNQARWMAFLSVAALAGLPAAQAQDSASVTTPKPLLQTLFSNNDVNGWKTLGNTGKASVVKDDTRPGADKNVLQYEYSVAKGEMNVLYLGINENEISTAQSFRFTVKADYPTTLAMALQEKEGGRYTAIFHVPGGKWQDIVLSPGDFVLARDANDPPDSDNKLDLDQVTFAGIADVSQFFAQSGDPGISQLFNLRPGAHTLMLSDFTISRQPVPNAISTTDARLDSFAGPQIGWIPAGNVELAAVSGKPLEGKGISAAYRQSPDTIAGLIRPIGMNKLAGKSGIRFTLASDKPAKVAVQLEEKGGGKYNTIVSVPGGTTATPFTIKFTDLKPSNDSKDDNNKFDPEKVYQVVLIDLSGMADKVDTKNTLFIGDLRAEP